ncbi:MAG: PsbP-related protein [Candidatus Woesebacteria bacterium]|nr:PsbP-related protein [Candidatus Woesebacteria bacterium]
MDPQAPNLSVTPIDEPVVPKNPQIPQTERDNHWISILAMAIFVLFSLGVVAFLYYQNQQLKNMLASYQATPIPLVSPTPIAEAETADWKTYTNTKYGFSFKYPSELIISTDTNCSPETIYFDKTKLKFPDSCGYGGVYTPLMVTMKKPTTTNYSQEIQGSIEYNKYSNLINKTIKIGQYTAYEYGGRVEVESYITGQYNYILIIPISKDIEINLMFTEIEGNRYDLNTFDQILSTFKFIDQSSAEGKFCGGIAANLPENQCPSGFYCKLDGNGPDTSGHCVKK